MFKFYIISTLVSIIVVYIYAKTIVEELKREGVTIIKPQLTTIEKIQKWVPYFIPFVNILLALTIVFCKDECKEETKRIYCKTQS